MDGGHTSVTIWKLTKFAKALSSDTLLFLSQAGLVTHDESHSRTFSGLWDRQVRAAAGMEWCIELFTVVY
jgi:hypothetical protein